MQKFDNQKVILGTSVIERKGNVVQWIGLEFELNYH